MRVCIRTVGCRTNKADTDEMARTLRLHGVRIVESSEEADWVVVNSCTVTRAADRDTRREAYRARRGRRDPEVLVVGCMPAAKGTDAEWADERTTLVADRGRAVTRILEAAVGAGSALEGPPAQVATARRHYIKIQEGCDQRCRYCIVPDARGGARSVSEASVLGRVSRAAQEGRRDVVLTGTHVGRWGEDLEPPRDLAFLLERIAAVADPAMRFRLSSLEPQDCTPEILDALRPPHCPHLHLPLQGGTDTLLRRMGRPYRTGDFAALVAAARACHGPALCIGADLMTGFPGETDEEFEAGLAFVETLDLSYLHVFTFSPRPGTPAASDPDPVPPRPARERSRRLRKVGEEKREAFAGSMVGMTLAAFVEAPGESPGEVRALTENFLRATVRGHGAAPGEWISMLVRGAAHGNVVGEALVDVV